MSRWKYKLEEEGENLRNLIDEENPTLDTVISIYEQLSVCLEFLKTKIIELDKDLIMHEIDVLIDDFQTECPSRDDIEECDYFAEEDRVNFCLHQFYDFCDQNSVWIAL